MCETNKHARNQYKLSSYYHDEIHIRFNKLLKINILIIKKNAALYQLPMRCIWDYTFKDNNNGSNNVYESSYCPVIVHRKPGMCLIHWLSHIAENGG